MNRNRLQLIGWLFAIVGLSFVVVLGIMKSDEERAHSRNACTAAGGTQIKTQDDKFICAKMDIISVSQD